MKKLLLILLLFTIPIVSSQPYYADIEISVDDKGYVSILGDTNHPYLLTESSQEYTSKQGKYWLLNITIQDSFSDFIFRLSLPKNARVNYIKTPRLARIDDNLGSINIIGTGEDQAFFIVTQYSIEKQDQSYWFYVIPIFWIGASLILLLLKKQPKEKKRKYSLDSLTDRQKKIFLLIQKHKLITQAELEKMTELPKSSLSRNIESLVRRGFIIRERKGMSNILRLN